MKRVLAVAAVAAIVMSFAPQASAAPCCYAGWHWRRAHNPFTITILSSVTSAWAKQLAASANTWSRSDKFDMNIVQGAKTRRARNRCVETSGEVHVCNGNYGATGWAGLTEVKLSGHHILKIRIRFNDQETPANFRRLVSCHELGHSIGLGHNTRSSSCMKPGSGSRPRPDAIDFNEIDRIYKHLDAVATKNANTADNTVRTIRIYDWVR